jgi:HTH-type transcriptional regulator/antitoxin HigA
MNEEKLLELYRRFLPMVIRDEERLEATQAVVDELVGQEALTEEEATYLDLLGTLIHEWEDEHERIPDIWGVELVRVLLNERGLRQRDLVTAGVFPTESIASEVLSGRRRLQLEHVVAMSRFFRLPPEVFLPDRELVSA